MVIRNKKTKKEKIPYVKPMHDFIIYCNCLEKKTTENVAMAIISLTQLLNENKNLSIETLLELYNFNLSTIYFEEIDNLVIRLRMVLPFIKSDLARLSIYKLFNDEDKSYKLITTKALSSNILIKQPNFQLTTDDFLFVFIKILETYFKNENDITSNVIIILFGFFNQHHVIGYKTIVPFNSRYYPLGLDPNI